MPFIPITTEQYERAISEVKKVRRVQAKRVCIYVNNLGITNITLYLDNNIHISFSSSVLTEWKELTSKQLETIHLSATEDALAVDDSDVHISIAGLLRDIFTSVVTIT